MLRSFGLRLLAAASSLNILIGVAWAGPFDQGRYARKGDDGLTSWLQVANHTAGRQRITETINAVLDFGICTAQIQIISSTDIAAHYNQKDFLAPQFKSCAFSNDTCGLQPCSFENVILYPSRFYKRSSDICKTVKSGDTESQPFCFDKTSSIASYQEIYGIGIEPQE